MQRTQPRIIQSRQGEAKQRGSPPESMAFAQSPSNGIAAGTMLYLRAQLQHKLMALLRRAFSPVRAKTCFIQEAMRSSRPAMAQPPRVVRQVRQPCGLADLADRPCCPMTPDC